MLFLYHLVSIPLYSVDAMYSGLVSNIGIPSTPTTASRTTPSHSNSSLFKAMFGFIPFLPKAFRRETTDGLIAPHTPHPTRQESSPVPSSPTLYHAPPLTPGGVHTASSTGGLFPGRFRLGSPPRRSQVSRKVTVDSGSAIFTARDKLE